MSTVYFPPDMDLGQRLEEVIADAIRRKTENYDFSQDIEEAVESFNLEKKVEDEFDKAAENFDFNNHIKDAVDDFEFDFEDDAKEAVDKVVDELDIEELVEAKLEAALFRLLEKPEVAERLVKFLFDRAAS